MAEDRCSCGEGKGDGACLVCSPEEPPAYWCDSCRQAVAAKRCPLCGLKARKMRGES